MDWVIQPCEQLQGTINIPGDKSISHRALILSALSTGQSEIINFLPSLDCQATLNILKQLGVVITQLTPTHLYVQGRGSAGLTTPTAVLDCGNSGTSFRLLAGVLAAQPFASCLVGDPSLTRRPMQRILAPLKSMGAHLDFPPLHFHPVKALKDIVYSIPIASAQVKTCLLFAGLCGNVRVTLTELMQSRDHTERMLMAFGVHLEKSDDSLSLAPGQLLQPTSIDVPGDFSSAAFFIAGAAMSPGSEIVIHQVGMNPTRTGLLTLLRMMGAHIEIFNQRDISEPTASLRIFGQKLQGIVVPPALIVSALDDFPAFFIAAAQATGKTILKGAFELRVKESDRIHTMAVGLHRLGIEVTELADGLEITGGSFQEGQIDTKGDHRVAMAFTMAAVGSKNVVRIQDCNNVATSFPGFVETARSLGLTMYEDKL